MSNHEEIARINDQIAALLERRNALQRENQRAADNFWRSMMARINSEKVKSMDAIQKEQQVYG